MLTLSFPSLCVPKSADSHTHMASISIFKPPTSSTQGSIKQMSKSSRLRSSSSVVAKAVYKVKLVRPNGVEKDFDAPDDASILDSADSAGIGELPYSCRAGACGSCVGKLASGSVDQSDGAFLDETQLENGYVLMCVAHPTSDCVIRTHKESDLY